MIEHFRRLVGTINPAMLTGTDRRDLLDLIQASLHSDADAASAGGGRLMPLPRSGQVILVCSSANSSSVENSASGVRTVAAASSASR